eukprot:TRINITY_DN22374_c0_g1_i2.p1 TRINITY_DN22374_c0_g1~~TRINITY_DN22374_c0_g1_i2.p1  ORF type:complete len:374 (-),score=73.69 TRINITY_DN22374_c0_g1_i2:257-1378(-)
MQVFVHSFRLPTGQRLVHSGFREKEETYAILNSRESDSKTRNWLWQVWAIICSLVSTISCFGAIFYSLRGGFSGNVSIEGPEVRMAAAGLFGWWVLGASFMTFRGPFNHIGNGFFAAWVAVIAAGRFAAQHLTALSELVADETAAGKELATLALASALVFLSAVWSCMAGQCSGGQGAAMLIGLLSLFLCAAIVRQMPALKKLPFKWVALGLFIWWCAGVFGLTFMGPYTRTGNAYFACWIAFTCAGRIMLEQFPEIKGYVDMGETDCLTDPQKREDPALPPEVLKPEEAFHHSEVLPTVLGHDSSQAVMEASPEDVYVVDAQTLADIEQAPEPKFGTELDSLDFNSMANRPAQASTPKQLEDDEDLLAAHSY